MALPRTGPAPAPVVPQSQYFHPLGALSDRLLRFAVTMRNERPPDGAGPVMVAQLEGQQPWLHEWLIFHRLMGIQHFLIYDVGLAPVRLPLLSARDDCTVVSRPRRKAAVLFEECLQQTERRADWLILMADTHFLFGLEQPLRDLLAVNAGYPALTLDAVAFGTCGARVPAGTAVIDGLRERALPVSGAAQRQLEAGLGRALIWNQRFTVRSGLRRWVYRRLARAAQRPGGVQLNQYLVVESPDEGELGSLLPAKADATALLTSRGPYDGAAAQYAEPVRRALGLQRSRSTADRSGAIPPPAEPEEGLPRELVVLGMQHGCVPAVLSRLFDRLPEPWLYLHNQAVGRPVFRNERGELEARGFDRSRSDELRDAARRSAFRGTVIHSYLDVRPSELAQALEQQPPLVGRRTQRRIVLIVRDLPNLYAVRLFRTRRRGWRGQLPVELPEAELLRQCWIEQAELLLGLTVPLLPQLVTIHAVRFLTDPNYREQIAAQLGLPTAEPLEARRYAIFDAPLNEEERAEAPIGPDWLNRWQAKAGDEQFRAFLADPQLDELLRAYAGATTELREPLLQLGIGAAEDTSR